VDIAVASLESIPKFFEINRKAQYESFAGWNLAFNAALMLAGNLPCEVKSNGSNIILLRLDNLSVVRGS